MTQDYLTISAVTKYLKRKFEVDPYLQRVYLTGEISNLRIRQNSHQYFSLKDDHAKISAVMFKGAFQKLRFVPKEGMKVLVIGRVSLYEASGSYQIYIEHMEPDGVGALYQALAELKEKLANEGLFSAPKKQLPRYPKRIAVLTSPSGAVIRDIITTVKRRYPIAQVVLFPTVVQGDQSADDLVRNLKRATALGNFDTLILGRGGGSIEDLWPFNEEKVARAIFACPIPIISSVGHETDTTIADLTADVRAATPTAAAELAVPVLTEELVRIKERQARLEHAYHRQIQRKSEAYQKIMRSYVFRQPERLYEAHSLRLDQAVLQLKQSAAALYAQKEKRLLQGQAALAVQSPAGRMQQAQQSVGYLAARLETQMNQVMKDKHQRFAQTVAALDLLSPLKIMGRGYSYTTFEEQVVKSAAGLSAGQDLTIHYIDGLVTAKVEAIKEQKT